jgi:hypothetical protein
MPQACIKSPAAIVCMIPRNRMWVTHALLGRVIAIFVKVDQDFYLSGKLPEAIPFILPLPFGGQSLRCRKIFIKHIQYGFLRRWVAGKVGAR